MKDKRPPQNTFQWAERIGKNPLYLTCISLSDLGDLLAYVRRNKQEAEAFCARVNPPLDPTRQHQGWCEADFIERAVLDELKRRNVMQPKEAQPRNNPAVPVPRTFAELFKIPGDEKSAVSALVKAGLIFEDARQWKDQRTTGAIRAVFEALEDAKMIHKIELTPGCKLIAERFGVRVVKNYPKARFTDTLRQEIKSHLDNNRDNNRAGI